MLNKILQFDRSELIIIGIALLLRIIWGIAVPVVPVSDSNAYDVFAHNLANGNNYGWKIGEPTAYWPPGTSFIYSIFYRIFGHTYWPIVMLNLFVGIVIIILSMYLAKIFFNRSIALLTGLILAFWPSQIQFTTVLASELLFNVFILAALAIWFSNHISLQFKAIGAGLMLTVASYIRPLALLFPLLMAFFRWIKTRELGKTLIATFVMFALMAVLITPWSMRNNRVFGQFVVISTNGGANLWMGNNPNSNGGYMALPPEVEGMNEAVKDDYLKSVAKTYIKEQPLLFIWRCVKRIIDTYSRESIGISWNEKGLTSRYGKGILTPLKILNQLYWIVVLALGIIGIALLGKESGWLVMITHPTVVIWGYFAVIHMIIVAQDRYHFPSIPMIAILAAFTINYFLQRKLSS